jgi:hypothetical protein
MNVSLPSTTLTADTEIPSDVTTLNNLSLYTNEVPGAIALTLL